MKKLIHNPWFYATLVVVGLAAYMMITGNTIVKKKEVTTGGTPAPSAP